ncbi:KpsF/GutQ family sugar-phosphate isomerase [Burkholderiaceae bacterium DAT-1]|nr:KpsF/GutQ family sugar-phosphate isomerase [Burkholderiaceae bacterium DAT-1]
MTQQTLAHPNDFIALARDVLETEMAGIRHISSKLDGDFMTAHAMMLGCKGRIVVTGIGKSGHIGRKIAATLASTGTPAFFMHPGEAAHGDLGMITGDDVVLAMSNSGESDELISILPAIKRRGARIIAMSGNPQSTLAKAASAHLDAGVEREACPINLAPTASTTAALALGDALAVCLMHARGFDRDDYALSHPGGSLGRRLLMHVSDVMHTGDDMPVVQINASIRDALLEISRKGFGLTAVLDGDVLVGVFTDGDLARTLDRGVEIGSTRIDTVMTRTPKCIREDQLAVEAVQQMELHKVYVLLVTDGSVLKGVIKMHDLMKAGVV